MQEKHHEDTRHQGSQSCVECHAESESDSGDIAVQSALIIPSRSIPVGPSEARVHELQSELLRLGFRTELLSVLQRAWAADPAQRYQSAEALWHDLGPALLQSLPRSPKSAPQKLAQTPRQLADTRRSRRLRWYGLALVMLLLATLGATLLWRGRRHPPPAAVQNDPLALRTLAEQVLLEGLRARESATRQRAAEALSHSHDPRYRTWLEPAADLLSPQRQR